MELMIFSFTENGSVLNRKLVEAFRNEGIGCEGYAVERFAERFSLKKVDNDLRKWIGGVWGKAALIFIGAAGIAVRMIAPWVKDKYTDSAVVVLDENGRYIVPLLSGHVGGATDLAKTVAEHTGGTVVLTTATDVQGKFAVDVFAKKNGLIITDRGMAKEISAAILEGKRIGIYSELPIEGKIPDGISLCKSREKLAGYACGIFVENCRNEKSENIENIENRILVLRPQNVVVGIGCRKGKEKEKIQGGLELLLEKMKLDKRQITAITSIDLKREEAGIVETAEEYGVPFYTFSAAQLSETGEVSKSSAFVEQITGVDNVCERAVKRYCRSAKMLLSKTCMDGMTFSVGILGEQKVLTF